jgi:hypothetical protein
LTRSGIEQQKKQNNITCDIIDSNTETQIKIEKLDDLKLEEKFKGFLFLLFIFLKRSIS